MATQTASPLQRHLAAATGSTPPRLQLQPVGQLRRTARRLRRQGPDPPPSSGRSPVITAVPTTTVPTTTASAAAATGVSSLNAAADGAKGEPQAGGGAPAGVPPSPPPNRAGRHYRPVTPSGQHQGSLLFFSPSCTGHLQAGCRPAGTSLFT